MFAKCKNCKIVRINRMRKSCPHCREKLGRPTLEELAAISNNAMNRARAARCIISTVSGNAAKELTLMSFMEIIEGQSISLHQARQMLGTA